MKNKKQNLFEEVLEKLASVQSVELPGILDDERRAVFARQVVDSIRRIDFVKRLSELELSEFRADPNSELFDPLKAAVIHKKKGDSDEAFWLLLLATHFGKSQAYGWSIVADVYGARGETEPWTWQNITSNFDAFDRWFRRASFEISSEKKKLKFNNHRKYQSFRYDTAFSVPVVVKSYIDYIGGHFSHAAKISEAEYATNNDKSLMFDYFFKGMKSNVKSFSRLGVFDLLTMWAKLDLVDFYPQSAYISGSTGPRPGATLLFFGLHGGHSADSLETKLAQLNHELNLGPYAMQILEDSLCNWQKSPNKYKLFRG